MRTLQEMMNEMDAQNEEAILKLSPEEHAVFVTCYAFLLNAMSTLQNRLGRRYTSEGQRVAILALLNDCTYMLTNADEYHAAIAADLRK